MRLRTLGLVLLIVGLATAGLAIAGVGKAREGWKAADADCAGSADDWCGGARTLVASVGLAFIPLLASGGMLLAVVGLVLTLLGNPGPAHRTVK